MARLSVILAVFLLVGLVILGGVQTILNVPESTLAGAATLEQHPPDQREINLCVNACMRSCVVNLDDNDPCLEVCEQDCGAR